MRKSKFTDEQIAFALKQAELGISVEEVCRKMGIGDATFYTWRKKYGGVGASELRRLCQLEFECRDADLVKISLCSWSSQMSPASGICKTACRS